MNSDLYKPYNTIVCKTNIDRRVCEVLERKHLSIHDDDFDIIYIRTSLEKIQVQCGTCGAFKI